MRHEYSQGQAQPQGVLQQVRRIAIWFVGLPASDVMGHRVDTQMRYTSAGFVVFIWYALMCVVWGKTGAQLFGLGGAVVFLLFPTLMLALDRMIISYPRSPSGALGAYAVPALGVGTTQLTARAACALAFSLATTSLFLIQQNESNIQAQQQRDHFLANKPVRDEFVGMIEAKARQELAATDDRAVQVQARRDLAKAEYEQARKVAEEAENRGREARFNAAAEAGGIDGRVVGEGSRHRAYSAIARSSQDDAINARNREARARADLVKTEEELASVGNAKVTQVSAKNALMASVENEVRADPRYIPRKTGLFADATTLIGLYGDPQLGSGLWVATLITCLLLAVSELAPLIACSILPCTPFDVDRIARDRSDAAALVADHELNLMSARSRRTVNGQGVNVQAAPAGAHADAHHQEPVNQPEEPK